MHNKATIDLKEAADFLGFKSTYHLREKAKAGKIPGAFKISNRWMFLMDDLIELARNYSRDLHARKESIGNSKGTEWQSAKRKTALITTRVSQSTELECKNLREQLLEQGRRNMRTNDEKK